MTSVVPLYLASSEESEVARLTSFLNPSSLRELYWPSTDEPLENTAGPTLWCIAS